MVSGLVKGTASCLLEHATSNLLFQALQRLLDAVLAWLHQAMQVSVWLRWLLHRAIQHVGCLQACLVVLGRCTDNLARLGRQRIEVDQAQLSRQALDTSDREKAGKGLTWTSTGHCCRACTPPWRTMAAMLSSLSAKPYSAKAALCCRLPLREAMRASSGSKPPACVSTRSAVSACKAVGRL